MAVCIFCPNELTVSTKPEHVLLNALGGRMTTTRAICSACNNVFGSTIDKVLADQVTEIRNMLQMESGSRSTAPMLRNVQAGSDTLNVHGDGKLELARSRSSRRSVPMAKSR